MLCTSRVAQGCSFFGGKEMNQRKPPVKKASFFPVGGAMGRQCYCAAKLITPMAFREAGGYLVGNYLLHKAGR
jgi:hypothetical protein